MIPLTINPLAYKELSAPDVTPFVEEVSRLIDEKLSTNKQIRSLVPHIFDYPKENESWNPEKKECALRDLTNFGSGINIISSIPEDCQSHILKFANGMQEWLMQKMYCSDQAVERYAALSLNELKISFFFRSPTNVLLSHVFKELTLNSSPDEINQLLKNIGLNKN